MSKPVNYKNRIQKLVYVKASDLIPNPWNFRGHPEKQREVLREVFGEIGVAGAVIAREVEKGKYLLIDGHLRREELGSQEVPVLVTDLSEDEAKMLLAVYDAVSDLAEIEKDQFGKLAKEIKVKGKATASLFSELGEGSKTLKPKELDLDIDDSDEDGGEVAVEAPFVPENSHVRMLQLYCSSSNIDEFEDVVSYLGKKLGTKTLTDTVIESMRILKDSYTKTEENVEKESKKKTKVKV
jgi:hypothetical protein